MRGRPLALALAPAPALVAVTLALAALAPVASAAPFLVRFEQGTHPLAPPAGTTSIGFWLNATCGAPTRGGDVALAVRAPSWAEASIAPETIALSPGVCADAPESHTGRVILRQRDDALAHEVGPLTITATTGDQSETDEVPVKAAFNGTMTLAADRTRAAYDVEGNAAFALTVEDVANADLYAIWSVDKLGDVSTRGLSDLMLSAPAKDRAAASHTWTLVVHGTDPRKAASLQVSVSAVDALGGGGISQRITLALDPAPALLPVPDASWGAAVAAVGVALGLRARRG